MAYWECQSAVADKVDVSLKSGADVTTRSPLGLRVWSFFSGRTPLPSPAQPKTTDLLGLTWRRCKAATKEASGWIVAARRIARIWGIPRLRGAAGGMQRARKQVDLAKESWEKLKANSLPHSDTYQRYLARYGWPQGSWPGKQRRKSANVVGCWPRMQQGLKEDANACLTSAETGCGGNGEDQNWITNTDETPRDGCVRIGSDDTGVSCEMDGVVSQTPRTVLLRWMLSFGVKLFLALWSLKGCQQEPFLVWATLLMDPDILRVRHSKRPRRSWTIRGCAADRISPTSSTIP
ncbi:hypothetical protein LZ30DRAFT_685666 [Colletotrichum cereale]|nr:hypothetical protein LZ30DRAFT_685666 [Colletotrichum cereale]